MDARTSTERGVGSAIEFEGFFRTQYPELVGFCFLLTGQSAEAEDLAQEALVRAFEKWDRVSAMESPVGYVYRTACNLNRHRLRRLRVRARKALWASARPDEISASEDRSEILTALRSLSSGQRAAVVLVEWIGMDADEAGDILSIKGASVRSRVHRAKVVLRERLADDHD